MHQYPLALLASLALAPALALGQADLDALIPKDAVFVVRVSSLAEFQADLSVLAGAFAPGEPGPDPTQSFIGHLSSLRQDLPAALAVSVRGGEIVTTLILPTSDASSMQTELDSAAFLIKGTYLGSCDGQDYVGGGSAFMQDFPSGTIAMRLDLAKLVEIYGPLIEMGVDTLRVQMEADPDESLEPMMDLYFDAFDDFLISAKVVDMSLCLEAGEATMEGAILVNPQSPMGQLASATRCDLLPMAKRLALQGSTGSFVMGADSSVLMDSYLDFMGGTLALYPEDIRGPLQRAMQTYSELFEMAGPNMGGTFDLDGGMNMTYVMQAKTPAQSLAHIKTLYLDDSWPSDSIYFDDPEEHSVGATSGFESRMSIDLSAMAGELVVLPIELDSMSDALFGSDGYPMWFGATTNELVVAAGPNLARREQALGAIAEGSSTVSPGMRWAIEAIGTSTPCFALEVDIFAAMQQLFAQFESLEMDFVAPPEDLPKSGPLTEYFVIDGTLWRGGVRISLEPWAKAIREMVE